MFYIKIVGLLLILLFCSLSISNTSNSQKVSNKITVRVGLIIFPPEVQRVNNDKCYGKALDRLEKIFPASEFKLDIYCASPARIYRDFASNKIDLTINIKSTNSLPDNIHFSKIPYATLTVMFYSNTGKNDKTISSVNKFEYHGIREQLTAKGYRFLDRSNAKEALTVFLRGTSSHLIGYRAPFEYYLEQHKLNTNDTGLNVNYTAKQLLNVPTYFAINTQRKHAEAIIEHVEKLEQPSN